MTCYNRRDTTLACLAALFASNLPPGVDITVVLVDDGSTDGTAEAVKQQYPAVVIELGNGSLFWSRGMHRAQEIAMQFEPDYVLWLNDDTVVRKDALMRMLATFKQLISSIGNPVVVVVGGTVDQATKKLTYAGTESVGRIRRFQFRKVWHPDEARECQAMNGNLVLIPRAIVERLGNLDPIFEHALGDIDYALRARQAGFRVFVAGGVMGYCSHNPATGSHLDLNLPLRMRWQKFTARKGLPPSSWLHFTRRHGGLMWPLYFVVPYLKFLVKLFSQGRLFMSR